MMVIKIENTSTEQGTGGPAHVYSEQESLADEHARAVWECSSYKCFRFFTYFVMILPLPGGRLAIPFFSGVPLLMSTNLIWEGKKIQLVFPGDVRGQERSLERHSGRNASQGLVPLGRVIQGGWACKTKTTNHSVNTSSRSTVGYSNGLFSVGSCSIQQGKAIQETRGGIDPPGKFLSLFCCSSWIIIQSQGK